MTDTPDLRERLDHILANRLPVPGRSRYQPLRMGLIGIWQYEEDVFYFHDGRLIFIGRNGSGKTKVLEVSSPFLFDAKLTARRLDPFGTSGRTMRDNLLYNGHSQRVSYTWCEYGRIADDGTFEYLTIGAGLKATETNNKAPESWYFVTPRRIGDTFSLYNAARQAHSYATLKKILGEEHVFEEAHRYQQYISQHLFGFASTAQLRSLVDLLLTLRRPKLSQDFNVDKLTGLLTDGLPAVSHVMLEDLARRFDELAREREEMQRHLDNREALRRFSTTYHNYARTVVADRARTTTLTHSDLNAARSRRTTALTHVAERRTALEELGEQAVALRVQTTRCEARVRTLENSSEVRQSKIVDMLAEKARRDRENADAARHRYQEAADEHTQAATEWEEAQQRCAEATQLLIEQEEVTAAQATPAGLSTEHQRHATTLRNTPFEATQTLEALCGSRHTALRRTRELIEDRDAAEMRYKTAAEHHNAIKNHCEHAADQAAAHQEACQTEANRLRARILEWSDQLHELILSDQQVTALHDLVERLAYGTETPVLANAVDTAAHPHETSLIDRRAELKNQTRQLNLEREALRSERDQTANERDPEPSDPTFPRRQRANLPPADGAPLWRLIDFLDTTPASSHALLEAALQGAGILDAWVDPRGRLLAADTLETILIPGTSLPGSTLANVLSPVKHEHISRSAIERILSSIGLHTPGTPPPAATDTWIATDGSWRIGPLHGRTSAEHASYIGVAARRAERLRRLAHFDDQLRQLDQRAADVERAHAETTRQLDRIAEEKKRLPSPTPLLTALNRLNNSQDLAHRLEADLTRAQENLNDHLIEREKVTARLQSYARSQRTGTQRDDLGRQEDALQRYRVMIPLLHGAVERWQQHQHMETKAKSRHTATATARQRRTKEYQDAEYAAQESETEHRTARDVISNEQIEAALAELTQARTDLRNTKAAQEAMVDSRLRASAEQARAEHDLQQAEKALTAATEAHEASRTGFRQLITLGLLRQADLAAPSPAPDASLDEHAAHAHRCLSHLSGHDTTQDLAQTQLYKAFTTLEADMRGPDWRCVQETRHNLLHTYVQHNGHALSILETLQTMDHEIDTRRTLLDEDEHRLFAEVLLGRLGNHLSQRRAEANHLVDRMNELLASRPTASNLLMRLKWQPDPHQNSEVHQAIRALDGRHTRTLAETERDGLINFLATRVSQAREQDTTADWKTHLAQALDYRRWCKFDIEYKKDGQRTWTTLTDKKHQKGSGGEKAVMLQLPLFIAAAAHYRGAAAHAPRPVYLDEAFAGIDSEMRGDCMGLLADLDLDLVMASPDETGFHAQVPGVATYHLYRDPEINGVLATPMLWDGEDQMVHRMTDSALYRDGTDDLVFPEDDPFYVSEDCDEEQDDEHGDHTAHDN
ncbi:TIGR02680 family protein [Streptomyces sp. DH7]|uniref:TIGR02680 family protein n=1 Tax=Streptomyces sp. DH7 TaxID=2857006 RepID=UPI001E5AA0E6|nr:TIGR02680 family protein [Streptomyces sp. DH7]